MRYYDELARYERDGFEVVVDKTWEDIHPRDCFDDSVTDIEQLCKDIDENRLDWFMLRVRVLIDGHELSSEYLGGCCYEDARGVLTDGTSEDLIVEAMHHAHVEARKLIAKLLEKVIDMPA
jgi:hypothetical protein